MFERTGANNKTLLFYFFFYYFFKNKTFLDRQYFVVCNCFLKNIAGNVFLKTFFNN